jgi:uncharacterized membrane protein
MNPKDFFTTQEKQQIETAICEAEKLTSGEIRLHIDRSCKADVLDQAVKVFHELNMQKTELRNGVLFYLSIDDRKFAVIGDKGINEKVPEGFWDCIYQNIIAYFQKGAYCEGLCWAIVEAGKHLAAHFPVSSDDINELTNEISFEK